MPYFGSSSRIVRFRVSLVPELAYQDRVGCFLGNALCYRVVRTRVIGFDGGWRDYYTGPKCTELLNLFVTHLVGHDENHLVALDRCNERQSNTSIATSCF